MFIENYQILVDMMSFEYFDPYITVIQDKISTGRSSNELQHLVFNILLIKYTLHKFISIFKKNRHNVKNGVIG